MTAASFSSKILKHLKQRKKTGVPEIAQKSYCAKMENEATQLVLKKKAPRILEEMGNLAMQNISGPVEFLALYEHYNAISTQMLKIESMNQEEQASSAGTPN